MRLALVLPFLMAACTSPESADLVGTWANLDDATWRVWTYETVGDADELVGLPNTFRAFVYEDGAPPVEVQRGTYAVLHDTDVNTPQGTVTFNDVLSTTVTASVDGQGVGTTYGDPIYAFTPKHLTIRSASATSGRRVYDKVDTLP